MKDRAPFSPDSQRDGKLQQDLFGTPLSPCERLLCTANFFARLYHLLIVSTIPVQLSFKPCLLLNENTSKSNHVTLPGYCTCFLEMAISLQQESFAKLR